MSNVETEKDDESPAINTETIPDVFLGINNREFVVERLMELLANPPDEMIIMYRNSGENYNHWVSGYPSIVSLLGAIEFMKQILMRKYHGDDV